MFGSSVELIVVTQSQMDQLAQQTVQTEGAGLWGIPVVIDENHVGPPRGLNKAQAEEYRQVRRRQGERAIRHGVKL